jgi:Mn-dependent DtxR family transcriptional regulator
MVGRAGAATEVGEAGLFSGAVWRMGWSFSLLCEIPMLVPGSRPAKGRGGSLAPPLPQPGMRPAASPARQRRDSGHYLACIFELIENKGYARVVDIANSLAVAEPSVSAMIKRLAKKGYVKREKYRGFTLTGSGQAMAHAVHFRRRILTAFVQSLGLPQKVIIQDVHGLEHHLSKQTLKCLKRFVKADRNHVA